MRRLATDKEQLSVVADQIGSPTWSRHIADATAQIISQAIAAESQSLFWQQSSGIYHLTASGQGSWYDFAKQIFEHLAVNGHDVATLNKTTTADYPTPATRPHYSVLNTDKLFNTFGIRLPEWRNSVALALAEFE